MKKQKFNHLFAVLSTLTLVAGSQAVYAQQAAEKAEAQEQEIEEVVVSGFRASVLNSIEAKRQSDVVSDVVDASAAGSLPAVSIADALGRVPGVTTVRDSGQSSQLNIRGMNGDFIQTTLNGREQASTSSYTESLRWMSFDQYPAELITQAAVYKSPKASHIEGGVAATVELKTANPLEAKQENNFNAGYRHSFNDAAKKVGADESGDRLSLSYQGKFMDDILGLGLGYSHLTQPNNFEGSRAGADGQIGYKAEDVNGDGVSEKRARAFQFQAASGNDIRDGYLATVVFQPNDAIKTQLDYFKSNFESEDFRHGVTIGGIGNGLNSFALTNAKIEGGILTSANVAITDPKTTNDSSPWFEARTEDQSTQSDSDSVGLNLEWSITDDATLSVDVAHSKGDKTRKDRLATLHAYEFGTATGDIGHYVDSGFPDNPATPGVDESKKWVVDQAGVTGKTWQELAGQSMTFIGDGDNTPTIAFNNPGILTSDKMRLSRYEEYPHHYTDTVDSFKVDFKMNVDFGMVKSFEAGVRVSDREFDSRRGTFLYGSRDGQFSYVTGDGKWSSYCADNLSAIACEPKDVSAFSSVGKVQGAPDHVVVDMVGLADSIFGKGNYTGKQVFSRDWTFVESGALEEKVNAVYLLANLETDMANIPVTGNIGVRVVRTDVKSKGVQNVGDGNGVPITDDVGVTKTNYKNVNYGPEYTDVLPSLNLNFKVSDDDQVRFALAKVMGRPPAGQLKGGAGSWNGGDLGANQYNVWTKGSPYLDPFRANQIDLSYEHYFEDGDAVTAAVFWKDIKSLTEGVSYDAGKVKFSDLGIQTPPGQVDGIFQTVQNTKKGGYIRGFELASTSTFNNLPGILSGLGTTASYSFTQSEAEVGGGSLFGKKLSLPGLSKNVWSITGFWDVGQFSTHLNVRYRDDYVVNLAIPGSSTPALGKAYTTVDYQASYSFDNGIDIIFEANNITNAASITSYGETSALGEYKEFGRQYYVGANYKF
jgi:iron complex outermembrane recepter protein